MYKYYKNDCTLKGEEVISNLNVTPCNNVHPVIMFKYRVTLDVNNTLFKHISFCSSHFIKSFTIKCYNVMVTDRKINTTHVVSITTVESIKNCRDIKGAISIITKVQTMKIFI